MDTLSIQPTFSEVISDVLAGTILEDTFWVNIIASKDIDNGEAQEEIIAVYKSGEELLFSNKHGLEFRILSSGIYRLTLNNGVTYDLRAPVSSINTGVSDVTAFDISPERDSYIIGSDDGSVVFGSTTTGSSSSESQSLTIKNAHFGTVLKSLFFPSGKVALTAGLDYQIKIWDTKDGSSPRCFTGHKERLTDLAMVDRGRNFLSSSFDGSVKLWDCASGNNIASFSRTQSLKDGVTTLHISQGESTLAKPKTSFEFGTLGKRILAGHESGVISMFDLGTRDELLNIPSLRSPVVSINVTDDICFVSYEGGIVAQWDLRNASSPILKKEIGSTVNSMVSVESSSIVSYGSGYIVDLSKDYLELSSILVGTGDDCKLLASVANSIYLTSPRGLIYKY